METAMSEIQADAYLDITDAVCPITFVKAKVALDELDEGRVLAIRLNGGEAIQNVPRSLKDEGHRVVKVDRDGDAWLLKVIKGGLL
jgi:TusA-related sulfurtransferase